MYSFASVIGYSIRSFFAVNLLLGYTIVGSALMLLGLLGLYCVLGLSSGCSVNVYVIWLTYDMLVGVDN